MNDQNNKLPTSFWVISIVGLLWNVFGIFNFIGQAFMTEEQMNKLPPEQQELFAAVPSWIYIIFAIAVITGTLGCLGLVMKKAWAVPLLLLSLFAVLIQMGYNLFFTNSAEVMGPLATILSVLVILVAVLLYYYARNSKSKGWIS